MFGFGFSKNIFLGVDIGTSGVKIVEIKESSGKPVLSNYARAAIPDSASRDSSSSSFFESVFPRLVRTVIEKGGFNQGRACLSVPAFGGLVTLIDFPKMSKEDMEHAIRFEAQKYIPMSLSDVVLSWEVYEEKSGEKENSKKSLIGNSSANSSSRVKTLLVAASKSKVMAYEKLAEAAGLTLDSIELESFSMARSLIGNDKGNFLIIDIGSRICNIILLENGLISLSRNIDAGGRDITMTIAKSLGISEERAESMKMSDKNFFESQSFLNFPSLELISGEASRVLRNFRKENQEARVDGVILSGGTANLSGIEDYFSQNLGEKVAVGDPFSRIEYPKKLEGEIKRKGLQFTVSAGLALKGFYNNNK